MPARKYTEQQRRKFMALIDRGGSVRAAAQTVGVDTITANRWMKEAGLSTPRSPQRQCSPEQKATLLRVELAIQTGQPLATHLRWRKGPAVIAVVPRLRDAENSATRLRGMPGGDEHVHHRVKPFG